MEEEKRVVIDETLGSTPATEVYLLSTYAAKLDLPLDHKILEIGSLLGKCTIAIACVAKHQVYTVDPHEGPWTTFNDWCEQNPGSEPRNRRAEVGNTWEPFLENLKKYDIEDKVVPIKAYSDEVKWSAGPIALLFLDGCHDYIWVKHDYEKFSPHVVKGGYIIFHDYAPDGYTTDGRTNCHIGVARAVDEILARGGEIEKVEHYGSLLVTRKVGEYAPDKKDSSTP